MTSADEEVQLINKLNSRPTSANNSKKTTIDYHHHQTVADNQSHQQQIRLLKQIVKTIEEKSLKEKTVLQKQLAKKRQECETLKHQLGEMRVTERGLRNELRQLANEVRMLKSSHNNRLRDFFHKVLIFQLFKINIIILST